MTDFNKYELILSKLALGMKQSDITLECKCSYGTITRAKKWAKDGKSKTTKKSSSSESSSSEVIERLDDNQLIEASVLETKIDELSDKYLPISSSENSSENSREIPKIPLIPVGIEYNSRFLSWMASVLVIENYWDLSKDNLKNKIIEKISKI